MSHTMAGLALLLATSSVANAVRYFQNYDPVDTAQRSNVDAACITALSVDVAQLEQPLD